MRFEILSNEWSLHLSTSVVYAAFDRDFRDVNASCGKKTSLKQEVADKG
jgi:hypothetical protein